MLVTIIALFVSFASMVTVLGCLIGFVCTKSDQNKTAYASFTAVFMVVLIIMFCVVSHFKPYL